MDLLEWLFDAQIVIGDHAVLWREVIGNVFGVFTLTGFFVWMRQRGSRSCVARRSALS